HHPPLEQVGVDETQKQHAPQGQHQIAEHHGDAQHAAADVGGGDRVIQHCQRDAAQQEGHALAAEAPQPAGAQVHLIQAQGRHRQNQYDRDQWRAPMQRTSKRGLRVQITPIAKYHRGVDTAHQQGELDQHKQQLPPECALSKQPEHGTSPCICRLAPMRPAARGWLLYYECDAVQISAGAEGSCTKHAAAGASAPEAPARLNPNPCIFTFFDRATGAEPCVESLPAAPSVTSSPSCWPACTPSNTAVTTRRALRYWMTVN